MLGTMLPYAAIGVRFSRSRWLALVALMVLLALSTAPHKEFRFALTLLPIGLIYAGHGARMTFGEGSLKIHRFARWPLLAVVVLSNILFGYYMSRWHQSGPIELVSYVAALPQRVPAARVHFWMPCHSTPFYSQIHRPIELWFPDCSPTARLSAAGSESQQLESHPTDFLNKMYTSRPLPTHAALFESMLDDTTPFLSAHGFVQEERFFHQHVSGDRDVVSYTHLTLPTKRIV
eukprot:TRINITY_DN50659_c0_g1_i1.p1 TRINITY_DN50659_c0_g1~~TRINITY_DN50659_c0_g1_i1.p1  ORF type:complete len:233 (+),score=28.02 TRINITY_DN50659_c0_g1_i1:272-970(+)